MLATDSPEVKAHSAKVRKLERKNPGSDWRSGLSKEEQEEVLRWQKKTGEMRDTANNTSRLAETFIEDLGHLIETEPLPADINDEYALEFALLPHIQKFVQEKLAGDESLDCVLYHHGRTLKEKRLWSESKQFQTVGLYGANVSDIFIKHPKVGAIAIELKLSKKGEGLTGNIQRAIGQSLIATMRHPYAICVIVYKKQGKKPSPGKIAALNDLLWEQHKIYLIVREQ
jgi:hypothetical protein